MSGILWRLVDVTVPGRRGPRLDRVSLEIPIGVTAILGPSGAGKTTLLNLLVGYERPSSGEIMRLDSNDDHRLPVFWSPPGHGLWPQLTVRAHLASIMPPLAEDHKSADRLLQEFDLQSLAGAYPATLSQGERDRLSLARAVASGAQVLVLDEPLVHVQPQAAMRYWAPLRAACRDRQTSIVLATHDAEVARREATHVLHLEQGRVVFAGDAKEQPT